MLAAAAAVSDSWWSRAAAYLGRKFFVSAAVDERNGVMFLPDGSHVDHAHPDDDLDKLHHADLSGLSSGALGNPGTLEDVSADIRFMDFDVYEGLKFEFSRSVTPNYHMLHMVHLTPSKEETSAYSVLGQFFTESVLEYLVARVDSNYEFFARFKKRIYGAPSRDASGDVTGGAGSPNVFFGATVRNSDGSDQMVGNVELDISTNTSWTNMQFFPMGQYVMSFHQQLTPSLSGGVELLHHELHGMTLLKAASRLRKESGTFIGSVQTNGVLQAQYYRDVKANRTLFASEFVLMPTQSGSLTSVVRLGWQQKFGDRFQVTSRVDTEFKVATQIETDTGLGQLVVSGELQHTDQTYKFGLGYRLSN